MFQIWWKAKYFLGPGVFSMIGIIPESVTWTKDTTPAKVPPRDNACLWPSEWLRGPSEPASDWSDAPRPQLTRVLYTCTAWLAGPARETCWEVRHVKRLLNINIYILWLGRSGQAPARVCIGPSLSSHVSDTWLHLLTLIILSSLASKVSPGKISEIILTVSYSPGYVLEF